MSTIWTPSGEYQPKPEPTPEQKGPAQPPPRPEGAPGRPPTPEEAEAAMQTAQYMLQIPVIDQVAAHAMELFQLAALHLEREAVNGERPDLEEARLAIDAFAALIDGLGAAFGPNEARLRDALAQLRLAYVQVS
jgi:hypothetical protein